jgi:mannosyltransferase
MRFGPWLRPTAALAGRVRRLPAGQSTQFVFESMVVVSEKSQNPAPLRWDHRQSVLLVTILLIAAVLRFVHLGRSSLWYDEVVTMRLARTESPSELMRLLGRIDATRAPLHPLILQGWLAVFGASDYSARVLSCLCGIITVGLVFWVARQAFDHTTALWAAWLSSVSPLLVYYSREVRMYAWLVAVACVSWGAVFAYAHTRVNRWLVLYSLSLIALTYSHPLGLLMAGALGLATLLFRGAFQIPWQWWLLVHLTAGLAVAPWIGRYTGHAPELITGLLPFRFLLGTPIGFVGGNFIVLLICAILIGYGMCATVWRAGGRRRFVLENPVSCISLLIWLTVPPVALYLYSIVAHPIFGPARYTLFVAPAYLILVARGLAKLPLPLRIAAAVGGAFLSGAMLLHDVYRPDLKADWKSAAAYLDRYDPSALVVVTSTDPSRNLEVESARYYLGPGRVVIPWPDHSGVLDRTNGRVWVSIGLRDGRAIGELPPGLTRSNPEREAVEFPGLRLMKIERPGGRVRSDNTVRGQGGPER